MQLIKKRDKHSKIFNVGRVAVRIDGMVCEDRRIMPTQDIAVFDIFARYGIADVGPNGGDRVNMILKPLQPTVPLWFMPKHQQSLDSFMYQHRDILMHRMDLCVEKEASAAHPNELPAEIVL